MATAAASGAAPIKLIKPDGKGIMSTVFYAFAELPAGATAQEDAAQSEERFLAMLTAMDITDDIVIEEAVNIYRELRGVEARLRGVSSCDSISFKVFPTLLSRLATAALYAGSGMDDAAARQQLMKRHVLPLKAQVDAMASAAVASTSVGTAPPAHRRMATDSSVGDPTPTSMTAPPMRAPPAPIINVPALSLPTPRTQLDAPAPALPPSPPATPPPPPPAAAAAAVPRLEATGSAMHVPAVTVQRSMVPSPSLSQLLASSPRNSARAPVDNLMHAQMLQPSAPPLRADIAAAIQASVEASLPSTGTATPRADALPPAQQAALEERAYAAAQAALSPVRAVARPRPATATVSGTSRIAQLARPVRRPDPVDTTYEHTAPPSRSVSAGRPSGLSWADFLTRQARAAAAKQRRAEGVRNNVVSTEAGGNPGRVPSLSSGTRRILQQLEVRAMDFQHAADNSAQANEATQAAAFMQQHGQQSEDVGAIEARPGSATLAPRPSMSHALALAGSDALYANAVNRRSRQQRAIAEADRDALAQASTKKTSTKSDALVRRRITREVAAACAALTVTDAHGLYKLMLLSREAPVIGTPAEAAARSSAGTLAQAASFDWWETPLSPFHVAAILTYSGFLSGPQLSRAVIDAAITSAGGDAPPALVESATLLSLTWRALTEYHTTAVPSWISRMRHASVPAVRLIALLHAVVTGGYDVRTHVLTACARDIGLDNHVLVVQPRGEELCALPPPEQLANTGALQPAEDGAEDTDTMAALAATRDSMHAPTGSLPAAFAHVIESTSHRLRALAATPVLPATESTNEASNDALAVMTHPPTSPASILAADVLQGRLVWPVAAIAPLKRLYTNRLAYLGRLTARDITTPAADHGASDAASSVGHISSLRLPGVASSSLIQVHPDDADARECSFAPALCARSLVIADVKEGAAIPREMLLLRFKAEADAKARRLRASRAAAEMEPCSFKPDIARSQRTRSASVGVRSRAAPALADGSEPAVKSRHEWLYDLAALQRRTQEAKAAAAARAAAQEELKECKFHPEVHVSPRAAAVADRTGRTRDRAADLLPRVADRSGSPGHSAARAVERSSRRSILGELLHVLPPTQQGTLSHSAMAADAELAVATAKLLRDPWTPGGASIASSQHGASTSILMAGMHVGVVPAPPPLPRARRGSTSPPPQSTSVVPATRSQLSGADAFYARMRRSAAAKEERRALEEALASGNVNAAKRVLHQAPGAPIRMGDAGLDAGLPLPAPAAPPPPPAHVSLASAPIPSRSTLHAEGQPAQPFPLPRAHVRDTKTLAGSPSRGGDSAAGADTSLSAALMGLRNMTAEVLKPFPDPQVLKPYMSTHLSASKRCASPPRPRTAADLDAAPSPQRMHVYQQQFQAALEAASAPRAPPSVSSITSTTSGGTLPLVYVDINLSPSHVERVPLWAHTDVQSVAAEFAARHALAPKLASRLVRLLEQQRATAVSSAHARSSITTAGGV